MTTPNRTPSSAWSAALTLLLLATLAAVGAAWWRAEARHADLAERHDALTATLDKVYGEVTRMRIEQGTEGKGAQGLLEMLARYAPMTSNARITEPDYQSAQEELRSVVRAFETMGKEQAWQPVRARFDEADIKKDFDEIKWLLEIMIRLDAPAGKQVAKEMLLGIQKPFPRLRWWAAERLLEHDKPLAQVLLRQVLRSETSRGIDMNRAREYGASIPDAAAYATTGFNNFVQLYLRSDDAETDGVLLEVLGRVEHDKITMQDCIKALGERKCARAAPRIKELYDNPPLRQQDFFFLRYCAQAVAQIEGTAAIPWLEEKLGEAQIDVVAKALQESIDELRGTAAKPTEPAKQAEKAQNSGK